MFPLSVFEFTVEAMRFPANPQLGAESAILQDAHDEKANRRLSFRDEAAIAARSRRHDDSGLIRDGLLAVARIQPKRVGARDRERRYRLHEFGFVDEGVSR